MISYEDGIAALEWLAKAFGFREKTRLTWPDGRLSHGEMQAGDGLIMLASPTPDYRSPKRHREVCEQARKWFSVPWIIDGVLVEVENLDRHPTGSRRRDDPLRRSRKAAVWRYRAEDVEGHRWFFLKRKRMTGRTHFECADTIPSPMPTGWETIGTILRCACGRHRSRTPKVFSTACGWHSNPTANNHATGLRRHDSLGRDDRACRDDGVRCREPDGRNHWVLSDVR
jgi:PhnB protein